MSLFNLCVCVPSGATWHADFALCLLNLTLHMGKEQVPGYKGNSLKVLNKRTSLLSKSRQDLLKDAKDLGCTHALFIDSDQTFPANIVHMLARHKKRVIACNVANKALPSSPTARAKHASWPGGEVVYSNYTMGIEQIWRIGTGVMLIDLSVLNKLPVPWFATVWNDVLQDYTGEDWYFCEQLEKLAIPIWIDHDASRTIGHIGGYTYEHSDVVVKSTDELHDEEDARLKLVG